MAADMADTKEISQGDYVVCVHHGADLDGWTSAALVQRWAKENNMQPFFFPMNYNAPVRCKELMEAFRPKYLIVADYSLTPDEYQELDDTRRKLGVECEFIWCYHHISAVRDWHRAGLLSDGDMQVFESGYQVTIGEFQDSRKKEQRDISLLNILLCKGQSGCRLLHKMLFPEEYILPSFVFYVDRYDVWDLDPDIRPDAEALQLACKVYDVQNPASDFWKEVIYQPYEKAAIRTEELIQEGRKYAAYQEKLNETAMEALSFTVEWHGHTWLAANITASLILTSTMVFYFFRIQGMATSHGRCPCTIIGCFPQKSKSPRISQRLQKNMAEVDTQVHADSDARNYRSCHDFLLTLL